MPELRIFDPCLQQAVIRFFTKCYPALGWGYDPTGRQADTTKIDETYMKTGCFWCLTEGDEVIGTAGVHAIAEPTGTAELKRFFVLPEYQGRQYGHLLLDAALRYCREEKYQRVRLDSNSKLQAALHIYRKYGFRDIEPYNGNTRADVFMELEL